jgi:LacI family transcriptional regulator
MSTTTPEKPQVSKGRSVTIRDVARHVGVTPMTVSRVFNDTGRISEATRVAVRQAMKELGYEPNLNAQRLAGARDERTVALLLPKLDFDVTLRKIAFLQQMLSERGYSVPLHAFGILTEAKVNEHVQLAHEMRRQKPRAIICRFGALPPDAQREIRAYQQEGGLVVSFNEPAELECDQVLFDREDNNYQSARYLLELGHRDIGFWSTHTYHNNVHASGRLKGFRRALREYGMSENPEWIWQSGSHLATESSGAEFGERLAAMKNRPTAICIVNDSAAQACVSQLLRAGIRVPDDISIISHDDLPIARYGVVPLTAMSQPIHETAEVIVNFIIDRLEKNCDVPPRCIHLKGELRVRESTAPLKI